MALVSSGQLSIGTIADNKDSASRSDISLASISQQFAVGAAVGDVDGNGSANQTADRNLLAAAPHAISELYGAEFVNEFYDTVVAQLRDGTVVTANGFVDSELGRISFDINNADLGTSYTAGLKLKSDNSVVVEADEDFGTQTGTKTIDIPAVSDLTAGANKYYSFVTTGTFENAVGGDIDHFDAIGAVSIDAVSTTTVANTSTDTSITHGRSIADVSSLNDYNWSFVKTSGDGSGVSDGEGGFGTVTSTASEPAITYRGPATFTADLRVDGNPSQGRNSTTATQVAHRIDYTAQVTIANPSDVNQGTNYNVTGNHKGHSGGIQVDEILASNNSVLSSNDDGTDSRVLSTDYSQPITPSTGGGNNTRSVKVKAHNNSVSATSNAFDIFPLLTTSKNTINPASETIFSQTDNPDTSTYEISFAFGSPGTRTDNITQGTYSEQADGSNAIALSGDLTPSSQTATQPTCTSTTSVGGATVRYTAAGNSSQSTVTDCAVTVNYATNIYQTAASIAGLATISNDITFSWSWQGVAISSERYELINQDDDAQDGNDLDVTDVTGGGAQSRNGSGSQTKTVANFGVSAGGTYKIKITLFSDGSHSTAVANALTPAFEAFAVTEFTSTIKGVGLEGAFFGYVDRLQAAENNSDTTGGAHNRIISQEIDGGKLFALNVNAGSIVATNNDLSTGFNPLAAGVSGATFFHRSGNVLNIGSDGVIDDVTDATPATPAINASTVSTATDDIEIRVTVNALVTRAFTVSVTPSGGSEDTNSVNASNQGASLSQDISLKTIGFSLAAGTAHVIKIRGTNEAENGSYSSTRTFSTDSASTAWTTVPNNFTLSVGSGTATSPDKPYVLANQSGNTTVTFVKVSGNNMLNVEFAAGTSANPTNFTGTGGTITLGAGTNYHVKVRHDFRQTFADEGHSAVFRITITNNSTSDTCDVSLDYEGE